MSKESVMNKMKSSFENTIPTEIYHALNVLHNAEVIMDGEKIVGEEREIIELTAILHDIGMINAKAKYNNTSGPYQEKEGPSAAKELLFDEDLTTDEIDRICHIIGHHHTFSAIDNRDFQIIWEADFLEALKKLDSKNSQEKLKKLIDNNFKTESGHKLAYESLIMA
ncbi:HD domain-containing protein [Terrisporobacter vanillatitrophus]|uniref:HD domain-containing protein n=1 Tax=Terrisporobacter vanillatitrophus TaxID=3058402 RepID=UPI00336707C0